MANKERFQHEPGTYENHPDFNKIDINNEGIPVTKVYTCNSLSDEKLKEYGIEALGGKDGKYPTTNKNEVLEIPLKVIFDKTGKEEIDLKTDPEQTIKIIKNEDK